jgi:acyl-CoA dehydrogenase
MISFEMSDFERELIEMARAQAQIAQRYARYFDKHHDERVPDELPEACDQPNVRSTMLARVAETSGEPIIDMLLYLEEIAGGVPFRASSNESIFLGSKLVHALGNEEQKKRWTGKRIAIALTEPGAGSDPSSIRTTAVWDQSTQHWILNGEKIFISLANTSDAAMVFARFVKGDQKGMSIFVVEKGTAGFKVGAQLDKLGQRSWDTADLSFIDCRLPALNKLDGNMKDTLAIFNRSRPLVAAIGLAYARSALDFTRDALLAAGCVLDYDAGSAGLSAPADRFLRAEASFEAAFLTLLHTKWHESKFGADKVEAAMTKASAGIAARRITQECMALLGAAGASEDQLLEMWFRDARVCDIYEGPGEINRLIIARDFLKYSASELS